MLRLVLPFMLCVAACGSPFPDLDSRLSPEARGAAFPQLQPLDPLLFQAEALYPSRAALAGANLEARAADLRRRAARLRALPL